MLNGLVYGVLQWQRSEVLTMVEPIPFSIPPIKVQIATVRKVDRKPNPRDEEKYNEKNRQAQSFQEILLSQSTSDGQNGKKVDLLL